jgi:hypothetical protein
MEKTRILAAVQERQAMQEATTTVPETLWTGHSITEKAGTNSSPV